MIIQGNFKDPLYRKLLLEGTPKDSGKTTFALSAGVLGPVLDLQYDFGHPTVPPGVPPENITVKVYESADPDIKPESERWAPASNVGQDVIRDLQEVRAAFREKRPVVIDGMEIPLPTTLVLDGCPNLAQIVMDWLLAINKDASIEDMQDRTKSGFVPWSKRLNKLTTIYNMVIPLPCNVILITWIAPETSSEKEGGKVRIVNTGRFLPDLGGKLDIQGPGKVDSALRCYSQKTPQGNRYMVSANGGDTYPGLGIRGKYEWKGWTNNSLDVTIEPNKPLPYEKVFGK